jgi:serine phosphatase RsbU (regulator of sigma subunit)
MGKISADEARKTIEKEIRTFISPFREVGKEMKQARVSGGPAGPVKHAMRLPLVDPVRFRRILVSLLKLLVVLELLGAFAEGLSTQRWERFGLDLVVAGTLWVLWGRITALVREQKQSARAKIEAGGDALSFWDAVVFSILWTDEIYQDIPADRRRLVVISYSMIALGLVVAFLNFGVGMMSLVVSGALVLGAVNLVTWLVSVERGEKETLKTEMRLAREVQMSLMPTGDPDVPGLDVAGVSMPAMEVGGDLFDYRTLGDPPGTFAVAVVDVSGKGMHAAMSAVFTSGAFATEARQSVSPAEIMTRLNRSVHAHTRKGHFVAFLLATYTAATRTLTFANAGQSKPLLCSGGRCEWLDPAGGRFPLGLQPDSTYGDRSIVLHQGDLVVFCTDGCSDAMNGAQEMYGTERIERLVARDAPGDPSARALVERLLSDIRAFMGEATQHDDMTIVVLKPRRS